MARSDKKKLEVMYDRLGRLYGKRRRIKTGTLLEQVIISILAADAKEPHAFKGFEALKKDYVDWNEVRICDESHLGRQLKRSGVNSQAPVLLKDTLENILHENSTLAEESLDELTTVEVGNLLEKIGFPKSLTASVLLTRPALPAQFVIPIDESVACVMSRVGLVENQRAAKEIRRCLEGLPDGEEHNFHRVVAAFARDFCNNSDPDCGHCPMRNDCEHYAKLNAKAEAGKTKTTGRYRQASAARQTHPPSAARR